MDSMQGSTMDSMQGSTVDCVVPDWCSTYPPEMQKSKLECTCPDDSDTSMPGSTMDSMPGSTADTMPGSTMDSMQGSTMDSMPGSTMDHGDTMSSADHSRHADKHLTVHHRVGYPSCYVPMSSGGDDRFDCDVGMMFPNSEEGTVDVYHERGVDAGYCYFIRARDAYEADIPCPQGFDSRAVSLNDATDATDTAEAAEPATAAAEPATAEAAEPATAAYDQAAEP